MVGSIKHLAEAIRLDLLEAFPHQRKTQNLQRCAQCLISPPSLWTLLCCYTKLIE